MLLNLVVLLQKRTNNGTSELNNEDLTSFVSMAYPWDKESETHEVLGIFL